MIFSVASHLRVSNWDIPAALQVGLPVEVVRGSARFAALLRCPADLGKPGKTGTWDLTVVLDTFAFLGPARRALKTRDAGASSRDRSRNVGAASEGAVRARGGG